MPNGTLKNTLYALALPIAGKRPLWDEVERFDKCTDEPSDRRASKLAGVRRALKSARAAGACVQELRGGRLGACYTAGYYSLEPQRLAVTGDTIFRTASIAKFVTALLVMRLKTLGRLDVCEDVSDIIGYSVRNPYYPDAPITLGMLMNHSSSIICGQSYARALEEPVDLSELLACGDSYANTMPGLSFKYSNLAAGMIGSLLEKRFGESLEAIFRRELFEPLGVQATFDLSTLEGKPVADGYRVLLPALAFDAHKRIAAAAPLREPCPERRYLHTAGALYISAPELAKLALVAIEGKDGFISADCLALLKGRQQRWREKTELYHGMGALQLCDSRLCADTVYGHQGIAYGAVNGLMLTDKGDGFVVLDSGASERRTGHMTKLNRDLIQVFMSGQ